MKDWNGLGNVLILLTLFHFSILLQNETNDNIRFILSDMPEMSTTFTMVTNYLSGVCHPAMLGH